MANSPRIYVTNIRCLIAAIIGNIAHKNPNYTKVRFCTSGEEAVTVSTTGLTVTVEAAVTEPVTDDSFTLGRQILANDVFGFSFFIRKAQYDKYEYDSIKMELKVQHFAFDNSKKYELTTDTVTYQYIPDGSAVTQTGLSFSSVDNEKGTIYFIYNGITAYEMALPITVTIYCENNGVVVAKSKSWSFSIADRFLNSTKTYSTSTDDKFIKYRTVYVDAVNFGTEAQLYFADLYPDSDLAKYSKYPNTGFEIYQSYATPTDSASSETALDLGKTEKLNGYTGVLGKGIIISKSNELYYTINPLEYDVSKLKLKIEYKDSYQTDKTEIISVNTLSNNGKTGTEFRYIYSYPSIALYDTDVKVTATLYLDNGDGNETKLYIRVNSIGTMVKTSMAKQSNQVSLGNALMRLTYSLRQTLNLV